MGGSIEAPLLKAKSGENGKSLWRKKRRKKWKFSQYSFPLFLHIIGSIEIPLFMAKKNCLFSPFSFPLLIYESRNQYGGKVEIEYGETMDLHNIIHNILHEEVENEYGEIMDLHNILHKEHWEKYRPANGLDFLNLNYPNNQAWNWERQNKMVWICPNLNIRIYTSIFFI